MEWYTDDSVGENELFVTLKISNVPYGSWTPNQDGLWLGISLGGTTHDDTDMIICEFIFEGTEQPDAFTCYDRFSSSSSSAPTNDAEQNVRTIETTRDYDTGSQLGDFTVKLVRTFSTEDKASDY